MSRRASRFAGALSPGLFRDGEFLKLWSATTISHFGTQVTLLALPLIAILALGAGPTEIGLLVAVESVPFLLIGLPAGVWVDRARRRPILIAADVGRGLLLASIPVAALADALTIAQLYLVGFGVGLCNVFFEVAYTSYLPSLVERDRLVEGNAKLEGSRAVASVAGPGLAGVLIGFVGATLAIVVDSLSFVVSALFLGLIRRPERTPATAGVERRGMRVEIVAGLSWVLRHPILRVVLAANTIANVFLAMFQTLFVLYLVDGLGLSAPVIGIVVALGNVGALAGAVVAASVGRRIGIGRAIALGLFGEAVSYALVALAPVEAPIPLLVASSVLIGVSSVVFHVNALSLRQGLTEERLLGRMTATYRFASWGVIPIGSLLAGILGVTIGLGPALLVSAAGGAASVLPILLSRVVALRSLPPTPVASEA